MSHRPLIMEPINPHFPSSFKTTVSINNPVFKLQSAANKKPTSSDLQFPSSNSVEADFTRTTTTFSVCCRNGDQGFGTTFESESFIDDDGSSSSGFPPQIVAAGLEALLNKLSKWIVVAFFAGVILLRHDAAALWTAMGFVINIVLSVVLKRILNQERPIATLRSDPGMPSSHTQSLFFATFFVIVSVVEWLGVNAISLSVCGLSFIFGSYFSWLRVSQRLHSMRQVFVGAVLGGFFSILWHFFWKAVVMKAFTEILWVKVLVLGASGFCIGFFIYIFNNSRDDI